jgi:hypothetical protein
MRGVVPDQKMAGRQRCRPAILQSVLELTTVPQFEYLNSGIALS